MAASRFPRLGAGGWCLLVLGVLLGTSPPVKATAISLADQLGPGGYVAGDFSITGTDTSYQTSSAALGAIQGDTGFGGLTPFNPAWQSSQVVGIGAGGSLTVHMSNPLPANGFTLGIFANNGLVDVSSDGSGQTTTPASTFSDLPQAVVSVSNDGVTWKTLNNGNPITFSNPTNYYVDQPIVNYYQNLGSQTANQQKPFLGSLTSFNGQTYAQMKTTLNGSAGGTWIDTTGSGLVSINYVRLTVPQDAIYRAMVDSIAGTTTATPIAPGQEIISESVGSGANTSHVVVDFGPHSFDFQVHYDGSITGTQALQLLEDNCLFRFSTTHFSFGDAVTGIDYGGYADSGFSVNGFWEYYVGDGSTWTLGAGSDTRTLTNGSYEGWSWSAAQPGDPVIPTAVPEPATLGLLLLAPAMLLRRTRR